MAFDGLRSRLAHKTPAELVRAAALRVWPLSSMTRAYYGLRFWDPLWRDVLNRGARDDGGLPPLDALQERLVAALRRDGIATVHVDALLGAGTLARVQAAARAVLERPVNQAQLAAGVSDGRGAGKRFVVRALDPRPALDLDDPLTSLPASPRLVAIAGAYFGFLCRLKSFDLWVNLPQAEPPLAGSQRWHRDYEDRNLLKIFLYLSDVDDGSGPMSFVRTSQIGGALGRLFPRRPPHGVVPADGEVERKVPADLVTTCTVPAGTLVLCDTTGLHKGGHCARTRRVAFTATYATEGAIDPDRYTLAPSVRGRELPRALRHALGVG